MRTDRGGQLGGTGLFGGLDIEKYSTETDGRGATFRAQTSRMMGCAMERGFRLVGASAVTHPPQGANHLDHDVERESRQKSV